MTPERKTIKPEQANLPSLPALKFDEKE